MMRMMKMEGISKVNKQASLKRNVFVTVLLIGVLVVGAIFVASEKDNLVFNAKGTRYQVWAPRNNTNVSSLAMKFNFSIYSSNQTSTGLGAYGDQKFKNATLMANWSGAFKLNITNLTNQFGKISAGRIFNASANTSARGNFTYLNMSNLNNGSAYTAISNGIYWWWIVTSNKTSALWKNINTTRRVLRYDTRGPGIKAISINTTTSKSINMSGGYFFTLNSTINDTVSGVKNITWHLKNATGNWTISKDMVKKVVGPYAGNYTNNKTAVFGGSSKASGFNNKYFNLSSKKFYFQSTNYTEGNYEIWVTAVDWALNNMTNISIKISIDKTAPTITPKYPISTTDSDSYRVNTPKLKIRITDTGPSELPGKQVTAPCRYSIDNTTEWNYSSISKAGTKITAFASGGFVGNNEYETDPVDELNDGNHTVWVICKDRVYNNRTDRWYFVTRHGGGGGGGGAGAGAAAADVDLTTETHASVQAAEKATRTFALTSGETHKITVKTVSTDSATFIIESTPKEITVKVGESAEVDVNDDATNDIKITLNKITGGIADFSIEKLQQQAPAGTGGEQQEAPKAGTPAWIWVVVIVVILAIVGGVFFVKKK